jgi:hypothetical protein
VGAQGVPEQLSANKSPRHSMYQAMPISISMYWNQYFPVTAKKDKKVIYKTKVVTPATDQQ